MLVCLLAGWLAGFVLFCFALFGLAWLGFSSLVMFLACLGLAWLGLAGLRWAWLGWAGFVLLCFAFLCFASRALLCFACLLAGWLDGGLALICFAWIGLACGSARLGLASVVMLLACLGLAGLGWAWLDWAGLALLCFALLACLLACLSDCLFACLLARLLACRGWGGGLHFLTTCNFQQTHRRNRSPPEVAPGGGTKQTKFQKLQALSDDRARVRKAFESAGGSSNKHFAIDCSLYHSTQRGGHRTTDGLVFCSSC